MSESHPGLRGAWQRLRKGGQRALESLRRRDLLPHGHEAPRLAESLPGRSLRFEPIAHWVSVALLLAAFGIYLYYFIDGNRELLFQPRFQTDDARTILIPYHRYGPEGALADDPIATEMLDYSPPGYWLLYRVLVPFTGLFTATKIVQALLFLLLGLAAWWILRSRQGGLAGGVILIFLVLHTWWLVNRMAGGLPRAFAFPCIALWAAGALTSSERRRYLAAILAALTYPSAMAMILAAEGLLTVRGLFDPQGFRPVLARLKRYALLVAACLVALGPFLMPKPHRGSIHTLEEAKKNPAFWRHQRLGQLPFADPVDRFSHHLALPFEIDGRKPFPTWHKKYQELGNTGAVLFLTGLLLLILVRLTPAPWPALAFLGGTVILYFLARLLAFRLYSPDRYYSFGGPAATVVFTVLVLGLLAPTWSPTRRAILRNSVGAGFVFLVCALAGDGVLPKNGMTIDGRRHTRLYRFARRLPTSVRFACHPHDGDDLPFWAARATTGGHETFQPWFKKSWKRQVRRAEDTIRALYATSRAPVLAYVEKYRITHFLLSVHRYGRLFRSRTRFFEPIGKFTRRLLAGVRQTDLVLGKPPPQTVVFRHGPYYVVDARKLKAAWKGR